MCVCVCIHIHTYICGNSNAFLTDGINFVCQTGSNIQPPQIRYKTYLWAVETYKYKCCLKRFVLTKLQQHYTYTNAPYYAMSTTHSI